MRHSGSGSIFVLRFNNDSTAGAYALTGAGFSGTSSNNGASVETSVFKDSPGNIYAFGEDVSLVAVGTDVQGALLLDNYTSATKSKSFTFQCNYYKNPTAYRGMNVTGNYTPQTAITSIDIVRASGSDTFSNTGNTTIRLYGIS